MTRITIVKVRKTASPDINQELQWLGTSLGLFNLRDKDKSCFRVFITLVRKAKHNESLSSDEIAERLHLTRGTVIHHLDKLMETGLVIREKKGYILRETTLQNLLKDIQRDMEASFQELLDVARELDEKLM